MHVFMKMHGLGNDILVADGIKYPAWLHQPPAWDALGNRQTGIGFNQALVLKPSSDPACAYAYDVWNQDGSEAKQCINGLRCLGHYLLNTLCPEDDRISLSSPSGPVDVKRCDETQMVTTQTPKPDITLAEERWQGLDVYTAHTGNQHQVIFTEDLETTWPALLAHRMHARAQDDLNCMLAQQDHPQEIRMLCYERGTGMTLACGSGAIAAAGVAVASEKASALEPITVRMALGALTIHFSEHQVLCTGPVQPVFTGTLPAS